MAAIRREVAPAPGEPDEANAELVEDGQELQAGPQGIDPLEGEEEGDPSSLHDAPGLRGGAAEGELPRRFPHLRVQVADLLQRDAQGHLRDVLV